LKYYATRLKVAGLIPDEVAGFFNLPNPSSRTMIVESTQPLTKMSTKGGVKSGMYGELESISKEKVRKLQ
jgi:hypothetical protein